MLRYHKESDTVSQAILHTVVPLACGKITATKNLHNTDNVYSNQIETKTQGSHSFTEKFFPGAHKKIFHDLFRARKCLNIKKGITYNIQSVVYCREFSIKQNQEVNVDVSCSEFKWTYLHTVSIYVHEVIVEAVYKFFSSRSLLSSSWLGTVNAWLSRIFSRTLRDLKLQFPGLSRAKVIFQDFPGPGILKKKNLGLPRRCANRENCRCMAAQHLLKIFICLKQSYS